MIEKQLNAIRPIDTTVELITAENIAFQYQLAGPFRRFPAWIIDTCMKYLLLGILLIIAGFAGLPFGRIGISFGISLYLVTVFVLTWFYGALFESRFNGKTPGKWLMGIRVVSDNGHPINGFQAVLRNVMRTADAMPPIIPAFMFDVQELPLPINTCMLGLLVMACSPRMQRIGDLVAGTMVIIDERAWSLPVVKIDDPRVPALASFIPADFRITPTLSRAIAQYAERRMYLSQARRREVAKRLADPLMQKFEFRPDIDPDLLLYSLYWRIFLADAKQWTGELGALAGYSPRLRDAHREMLVEKEPDAPAQLSSENVQPVSAVSELGETAKETA